MADTTNGTNLPTVCVLCSHNCGIRVDVQVVESARPAEVILESVRGELVELIAMTTRGAGGLRRLVLGSTSTRVSAESTRRVLVVQS